jgi:hypothetical protein
MLSKHPLRRGWRKQEIETSTRLPAALAYLFTLQALSPIDYIISGARKTHVLKAPAS